MAAIQRPNAVEFVHDLVQRGATLQAERDELQKTIATASARLEIVERELVTETRNLTEELERMDLKYAGNFGWEYRSFNFYIKLLRVAKATPAGAEASP